MIIQYYSDSFNTWITTSDRSGIRDKSSDLKFPIEAVIRGDAREQHKIDVLKMTVF